MSNFLSKELRKINGTGSNELRTNIINLMKDISNKK